MNHKKLLPKPLDGLQLWWKDLNMKHWYPWLDVGEVSSHNGIKHIR
jgi:hypothetical protein